MSAATDKQVQQFVDERVRPRCEQIRALINSISDDIACIDDIYAALTQATVTWTDNRNDAPPHLLDAGTVLSINAFYHTLLDTINGSGDKVSVLKACVRPV